MENSNLAPNALHHLTISIVCASAQSDALKIVEDSLTQEEADIVRRGRNSSKAAVPKSATPKSYRSATALEALFGYLSMTGNDLRIKELFYLISKQQITAFIKDSE